MATFVLVPGADGLAWYWHRVVPLLEARGHEALPVDMPTAPDADLKAFADAILDVIGTRRTGLVVVGMSLGGFTAPLVCDRVPVDLLVLVNAMVPVPGESAAEWWGNTGQKEGRRRHAVATGRIAEGADLEFDMHADFFHDVPDDITAAALALDESGPPDVMFEQPWPMSAWPDVPTRFLQGREDRLFPLEFQRRVVAERLGIAVDETPGGHCSALSRPEELVDHLCALL